MQLRSYVLYAGSSLWISPSKCLGLEPKWHCHFGIPRQHRRLHHVSTLMVGRLGDLWEWTVLNHQHSAISIVRFPPSEPLKTNASAKDKLLPTKKRTYFFFLYHDRYGRCIAILLTSIAVKGRRDSPDFLEVSETVPGKAVVRDRCPYRPTMQGRYLSERQIHTITLLFTIQSLQSHSHTHFNRQNQEYC